MMKLPSAAFVLLWGILISSCTNQGYVRTDDEQAMEAGYKSYHSDWRKAMNGDERAYSRLLEHGGIFDGEGAQNYSARLRLVELQRAAVTDTNM